MTKLEKFREVFSGYEDYYTVIGGTACQILIDDAGGDFRATADLDIVVIIEAPGLAEFGQIFWGFVREGGYQVSHGANGSARFYRFVKPLHEDFPKIIELFSRMPLNVPIEEGQRIVPISMPGSLSSLSAILLDDDYYNLLKQGRRIISGLCVLDIEYLILFKMKAHRDLASRHQNGEQVDSRELKKHQRDVFRLWEYADMQKTIPVSQSVHNDILGFLNNVSLTDEQLSKLGIEESLENIVEELRGLFFVK